MCSSGPIDDHPAGGDRIHPHIVVRLKPRRENCQHEKHDDCRQQTGEQKAIVPHGSKQRLFNPD